jgi:phosphate ABC transporter phosphate-binding protein
MRSFLTAAGLAALALGVVAAAPAADAKLSGSGSSFIKPIMDKWIEEYAKSHGGVDINYQALGSGAGVKNMIDKSTDFGCTDAFMKKPDLEKAEKDGGPVLHIPLIMGAIVPAYNLDVDQPLNFSGEVLADIFMGKIKKWNDAKLAELNKDAKLPDTDISVVHRADSSGSTNIFTSYLSKVSPEWKDSRGAGNTVDWKGVGAGEPQTAGVAGAVSKAKGAIGYIELTYALQNKDKIKYGLVKNKEGKFILASPKSVSAAADAVFSSKDVPEDLRFSLVDAPGADSYPISGATWAVLYANSRDNGKRVAEFLGWCVHDGQKYAEPMSYAPLPESLVKRVDDKLKEIK